MSYNIQPRGDVKKLVKWAQEYITSLQREIERQDNHIKELSFNYPGSNVVLDTKVGRPDVTLPPDSDVRFYLGDSRESYNDMIEVHHNRQRKGLLEVRGAGGRLAILPSVSNAVSIRLENH